MIITSDNGQNQNRGAIQARMSHYHGKRERQYNDADDQLTVHLARHERRPRRVRSQLFSYRRRRRPAFITRRRRPHRFQFITIIITSAIYLYNISTIINLAFPNVPRTARKTLSYRVCRDRNFF